LLISDLGMPGHDGYWLIKEIRAAEKATGAAEHLPAVALTAYGRVEDRVAVLAAGFDSHVVKPVDPAELAAVINDWWKRAARAAIRRCRCRILKRGGTPSSLGRFGPFSMDQSDMTREQLPVSTALRPQVHVTGE